MKRSIAAVVTITLLISSTALTAQGSSAIPRSREYWFAYASKLPIGSTIRVRTLDGKRLTAVLAVVDEESIILEARTRIPEPPRRIPFDQLEQLELQQKGSSVGKSIAAGAAVGAGTFLGVLLILAAALD
jgi:hypothetical protein